MFSALDFIQQRLPTRWRAASSLVAERMILDSRPGRGEAGRRAPRKPDLASAAGAAQRSTALRFRARHRILGRGHFDGDQLAIASTELTKKRLLPISF